MRRFLLHVLPTGLKRIRHYGLLAASKAQSLAHVREQMQMPQSNPVALELAQDFHAPGGSGGPVPVSLLPAWTAALGGNSPGLQDLTSTGGADCDYAAHHGASMNARDASISGMFGVAGLQRQAEPCAQWRDRLVLGVTVPRVVCPYYCENETIRQRSSAKRLNGAPEPELQTYNPL